MSWRWQGLPLDLPRFVRGQQWATAAVLLSPLPVPLVLFRWIPPFAGRPLMRANRGSTNTTGHSVNLSQWAAGLESGDSPRNMVTELKRWEAEWQASFGLNAGTSSSVGFLDINDIKACSIAFMPHVTWCLKEKCREAWPNVGTQNRSWTAKLWLCVIESWSLQGLAHFPVSDMGKSLDGTYGEVCRWIYSSDIFSILSPFVAN